MVKCNCGRAIGMFDRYCDLCKENLTLREKVIEGIREDKIYGSYFTGSGKQ